MGFCGSLNAAVEPHSLLFEVGRSRDKDRGEKPKSEGKAKEPSVQSDTIRGCDGWTR